MEGFAVLKALNLQIAELKPKWDYIWVVLGIGLGGSHWPFGLLRGSWRPLRIKAITAISQLGDLTPETITRIIIILECGGNFVL
jgi:hypothetical protein